MPKYRYVKNKVGKYVVQKRFLLFFWENLRRDELYGSPLVQYHNAEGAVRFIKDREQTEARVLSEKQRKKDETTIVEVFYVN